MKGSTRGKSHSAYCERKFVLQDDLREHERIHSGEKPFSCSHCEKKFVLKDNLKEHEGSTRGKSHSAVLIGRIHLTEVCDFKYKGTKCTWYVIKSFGFALEICPFCPIIKV